MKKMDLSPEDFGKLMKEIEGGNQNHLDMFNLLSFNAHPMKKDWGYKINLEKTNSVIINICFILSGGRCSEHYHKYLINTFTLIYGKVNIYFNGHKHNELTTSKRRECTVRPGDLHYFQAETNSILLEIYYPCSLRIDNDIERTKNSEGGIIE